MGKNFFVFVVCGSREHVDTLHYSIQALKQFSGNEIWVVTDPLRNEIHVNHCNIVNVCTPEHLDHHQASIFLKTGLHKFLPSGNTYCYLDTDVVAVNSKVDSIFSQFVAPITFAPDHCVLNQFSPSAIKCTCKAEFHVWQNELKQLFIENRDLIREPEDLAKKTRLIAELEKIKKNKLSYWLLSLKFNLSTNVFKLDDDTYLDKQNYVWVDKRGKPILYEKDVKGSVEIIESKTDFRCGPDMIWRIHGKEVFDCRCEHLERQILKTFGVTVGDPVWQHWNGGVFLFNDSSSAFLDTWHENTIRIFSLPEWETRDQGTLIATVWQMDLQRQPMLSPKYNLIADYGHKGIKHVGELKFAIDNGNDEILPYFVHVYHHWADQTWDVWQQIEKRTCIVWQKGTEEVVRK